MTDADIFYKESGRGWAKYCIRSGTKKEIEETAMDLLKEVRVESARSQVKIVWAGGRTTMVRLQKGEGGKG